MYLLRLGLLNLEVEKNDHELTLALYNSERLNNSVNSL